MHVISNQQLAKDLFEQGYLLQIEGAHFQAMDYYRRSIEVHPTPEAHQFLGFALGYTGQFDRAIAECRKALELDPNHGGALNDIGAYLIAKGESELAMPYLEAACRDDRYSNKHFCHYNMGRILERRGCWFEALQKYRASLNVRPGYEYAQDAYYRLQGLLN